MRSSPKRIILIVLALTIMTLDAQPSFTAIAVWARTLPNLQDPTMVRIADVNRDGIPDVVLADNSDLITPLGQRDGSVKRVATAWPWIEKFVLDDLDGDGIPDALAISYPGIQFFHGNGDGTFARPIETALPTAGDHVLPIVRDFDGDGIPDIACR